MIESHTAGGNRTSRYSMNRLGSGSKARGRTSNQFVRNLSSISNSMNQNKTFASVERLKKFQNNEQNKYSR